MLERLDQKRDEKLRVEREKREQENRQRQDTMDATVQVSIIPPYVTGIV